MGKIPNQIELSIQRAESRKKKLVREEIKEQIRKQHGRIRPLIGNGNGLPSEARELYRQLQAEVKEEMKLEAREQEIQTMEVKYDHVREIWRVNNHGHSHVVVRSIKNLKGFACSCVYYKYHRNCKHVEAVHKFEAEKAYRKLI